MTPVLHTVAVYVVLLAVFRLAGKRALADMDAFEMVVLLIISESTQQALVGDDYSLVTCFTVIITLVGCGLVLSVVKQKSGFLRRLLDGLPVVLVDDGRVLHDRMEKLHVDLDDLLEAAHVQQGIGKLDEIRYAILERSGEISIIPRDR